MVWYSRKLHPMSQKNKDQYGEVPTPDVLIDELLDHLPAAVWKNPDLRWLDPCAGTGLFFIRVHARLMTGLAAAIPGEAARRRHIAGMLTMVELNPARVRELRAANLGRVIAGDFLDENLFKGSFIETRLKGSSIETLSGKEGSEGMRSVHGFHCILANPPYQATKTETYAGAAGNRTLWDKFVVRALSLVNPTQSEGFLGFITPANWRRPEHPLYREISDRLRYLHIYGKAAGRELFGVQTRFDVYVLGSKGATTHIPEIVDEHGETHRDVDPRRWAFLPNFAYRTVRRLLISPGETPEEHGVPVIFDSSTYDARHLSKRRTERFRYPVVHTLTQAGTGLRYAETRDSAQFGVAKVILNANEKQYPVLDLAGKYGMSQLSFGLPVRSRSEGEAMMRYVNGDEFREVVRATKWGSFQTDYRMFRWFRRDFYRKGDRKTVSNRKGSRTTVKKRTSRKL